MIHDGKSLKNLLPYGSIRAIAKKLGVSTPAVSQALKQGKPGNRIVQEAVHMAQESGALATAQALASISATK
jgi:predicted transcriptional regulator